MSTPFYTTMPPPPRRHPLATAANHYAVNAPRIPPQPAPRPPPKQQVQPPKEPSSPPLPRQNAKVTPPSPPQVITDSSGSLAFKREGLLGEVSTHSSSLARATLLAPRFSVELDITW